MIEILKILASLIGGGLAGAFFNEWLRRRRSGVQRIPLIERVNRRVSSDLKGFALARRISDSSGFRLEEVLNLREYQLTLKNSSPLHLEDAEVQFEFPADDVQAWASRPALSKTALVPVDATASPPWKRVFRWKIPHCPSGDSVEFTFQAVNPESDKFEAALYHSDGIVLERVESEPRTEQKRFMAGYFWLAFLAIIMFSILGWSLGGVLENRVNTVGVAIGGCELQVSSSSKLHDDSGVFFWKGPWKINDRVVNVGPQDCTIRSIKLMLPVPYAIKPGDVAEKERFAVTRPKMVWVDISVGSTSTQLTNGTVPAYVEP